ncbi:MAG: YbaK/EbsC family protein [Candidatus Bathyarchaeia archaeon]
MKRKLSPNAQKIQEAIRALGFQYEVIEFQQATRSSQDAAKAIGCYVGQIAKSIIFRTSVSKKPVLVIASGANKVNEKRIAHFVNEPVEKADAEFVREMTGFAIGGVPPVGHLQKIETFIDEDLFNYEVIWAAAGTPHAVFALSPQDMVKMTRGKVVCVK